MADEITADDTGKCAACDIVWNILMVAGAVTLGFIAYDTLTGGKGTEYLTRVFAKVRPSLAAVIPIREETGLDDAG